VAKVSMRLVADQDPGEAARQLEQAVARVCPRGVKAQVRILHSAGPSLVDPDNRFVRAAAEALAETFGQETVYVRSGGSIPIVGLFQQHLGIPSVLMGFGLPDDNLHAPNEKFHLPNLWRGMQAVVRFLEQAGE
jgi:acetylornithine deacetylase/succinyl-diaminopimelate desuccinylase-like protein